MLVPIDRLRPDSTPIRRRQWPEDDAALRASIAELGLLDPLLVVRLGDDFEEAPDYEVKDGNRRLAAARALGLLAVEVSELPRRKADYTAAAATAANLVRAPLDAVDQWRAIVMLQERGYTLPGAAACLGLSQRHAMQLDKLGRLHPDMLALIEAHGLPNERTLALVAAAPPDVQQKAATAKGVVTKGWDNEKQVNWPTLTQLCARIRFPRTAAIFDIETAGLPWELDPFAQPGSADEWTTGDIKGFLAAQRRALEELAAGSKGKLVLAEEAVKSPGSPVLPQGWRLSHGDAAKPKRNETVFAIISSRTGEIVRATAINPGLEKAAQKAAEAKAAEKAKEKAKKAKAQPAAPTSAIPSAVGTVETPLATAKPTPDDDEAPDGDGDLGDGRHGDEDDDAPLPAAPAPKPPMTKEGQKLLARYKTEALRARLRDRTQPISNDTLVPLLILALHAKNVEIRGYDQEGTYGREQGQDLVRRLITPEGHLQFDGDELPHLAGEALARVLRFSEPDANSYSPGSGPAAEWIAAALDAQHHLPRLDTAEFLATLAADKLKNAAVIAGEKFTTATAAKRDLPGKLPPTWRPDYTHFGAPGPKPAKGQGA